MKRRLEVVHLDEGDGSGRDGPEHAEQTFVERMRPKPSWIEKVKIEKNTTQTISESACVLLDRDKEPAGQGLRTFRRLLRVEERHVQESRSETVRLEADEPASPPPGRLNERAHHIPRGAVANAGLAKRSYALFAQAVGDPAESQQAAQPHA